MLSRLLGSLCLVAAAIDAAPASNPSNPSVPYRCEKPSPSFCTNVDWVVSNNSLAENSQNMAEVVLEIAYYSQPGTDECKKKYKDIECRRRFPYCDPPSGTSSMKIEDCKKVGECIPCKAECEDFVDKCPGSPLDCGVYPEKIECYRFTGAAGMTSFSTTMVLGLVSAAVLFVY